MGEEASGQSKMTLGASIVLSAVYGYQGPAPEVLGQEFPRTTIGQRYSPLASGPLTQ
jgi:hypothetical protein